MKHRLYSLPSFFEGEASLLNRLFEAGLPCLHLRKPQQTLDAYTCLLEQIDASYYSRIIVHQYPELVSKFGLLGLHLTEAARQHLNNEELQALISEQHQNGCLVGTSVHQKKALFSLPSNLDYSTVSPIFPSISKQNYQPTEHWQITELEFSFALVGLGGMGMETLEVAYEWGFREVAFLGAVWNDLSSVLQNYQLLCKKINDLTL